MDTNDTLVLKSVSTKLSHGGDGGWYVRVRYTNWLELSSFNGYTMAQAQQVAESLRRDHTVHGSPELFFGLYSA